MISRNQLDLSFRRGIDGKRSVIDGEKLSIFLGKISKGEVGFDETVIHAGFGLPKDGIISDRLPITAIPALEIIRELKNLGIKPPKVLLYLMTTVISSINQICEGQAVYMTQQMEKGLWEFIKAHYNDIQDYVTFSFGKDTKEDLDLCGKYSERIGEVLDISGDGKIFNQFVQSASKHGNGLDPNLAARMYISANTLCNGGFSPYLFKEQMGNVRVIIPVGGQSERGFFNALSSISDSILGGSRNIFPILSSTGKVPGYYDVSRGSNTDLDYTVLSQYKH